MRLSDKILEPSILVVNHTSHLDAQVPVVMIYVDGPVKILGRRSELIVDVPFRLDPPVNGMNSDYINEQTLILQERMKSLMELFVKRKSEK